MTTLSPDQQVAADKFMEFIMDEEPGEMVIQGHAGVGKSFMTTHLLELVEKSAALIELITSKSNKVNVVLTASTNKAAAVLEEITGRKTHTIHSILSLKVFNNKQTGATSLQQAKDFKPINNTLVIVDEASMVNSQLLTIIRNSCKKCKVLYIMDSYQLAPIKENYCPVSTLVKNKVTLSTIHRQATNSPIIQLAEGYRKVLDGGTFPSIVADGVAIQRVDGPKLMELVNAEFSTIDHNIYSGKILAWKNEMVKEYNKHVRALHTSSVKLERGEFVTTNKPILNWAGSVIHPTDSIVQICDIEAEPVQHMGVLSWLIILGTREVFMPVEPQTLKVAIAIEKRKVLDHKKKYGTADWSKYFRLIEGFVDLRPVHASTVHKSQGSTHDTIFINLNDIGQNHKPHEVARLMYVAVTRAASKVILYGRLGARYGD